MKFWFIFICTVSVTLPVVIYTVEVYTGSKPGSDTEASLYIELYGKRGDSGRRVLYQSKNNDTKFQEGQVDIFSLEAVDLDDIEKVVIGHDEKGKGSVSSIIIVLNT